MIDVVLVPYTLLLVALLLGVGTVPLAVRGASVRAWRLHAFLAVAVTCGLTFDGYRNAFVDATPWWHVALAFSSYVLAPILCAGWAARRACRWSVRAPGTTTALVVAVVLVGAVLVGVQIARRLLPEIIRATA